jgi:hypothetical protein
MKELNCDGNILGRAGAVALLLFVAFSLRGMNTDGWMCPLVKTMSCCTSAAAPAASAPAKP